MTSGSGCTLVGLGAGAIRDARSDAHSERAYSDEDGWSPSSRPHATELGVTTEPGPVSGRDVILDESGDRRVLHLDDASVGEEPRLPGGRFVRSTYSAESHESGYIEVEAHQGRRRGAVAGLVLDIVAAAIVAPFFACCWDY
jgi:hypothetical protein